MPAWKFQHIEWFRWKSRVKMGEGVSLKVRLCLSVIVDRVKDEKMSFHSK
jgi:hypothetical protein